MSSMPITVSNKPHTHTTRVGWWWLLSALVHVVALLAWLQLSTSTDSAQSGETTQAMIQVSLVTQEDTVVIQQPTTPVDMPKPKAPAVTATTAHREPVAHADTPLSEQQKENSLHTVASAPVTPTAKAHPKKFSSMLHQAIDSHKHYPLVALRMRQQGTARVRFRLFEDGRIEDVTLLQTSGYQSLDHSALHAVESIAPFTPAREYLSNDEQFYVDIVFRI